MDITIEKRVIRYMEKNKFYKLKKRIIRKAMRIYGHIRPCGCCKELEECFTQHGNSVCFWFNTEDMQTHMLKEPTARVLWSSISERTS